jgi:2-polyprenyl-6-methoxyphenol hydroxylase-like FAD-dependent oxidoreductase
MIAPRGMREGEVVGLDSAQEYDAIVVGARVAGSATALGLARRGWRVLLLDGATFPSDTLSTHLLWSDALREFDRMGVLGEVLATGAPPIERIRLAYGEYANEASIPSVGDYPPLLSVRRIVLDELLLDAARGEAGITVREGVSVAELLRAGEAVVGVRGVVRGDGEPFLAKAGMTVGADGRHSTVARGVGAAEYDVVPPLLATYYRYYRGVEPLAAPTLEAYRDVEGGFCYLFPCDGGYWTLAVSFPQAEFDVVRRDHEAQLAAHVTRKPGLSERLAGAEPVSAWRGAGDLMNFYRVPFGPGWALVGDAGQHKDPITARGIADALRHAALLVDALDRARRGEADWATALGEYQKTRDAQSRALYDFTVDRVPDGVAVGEWSAYLGRTLADEAFLSRYVGFMATMTLPEDFYSAEAVREVLGAG